MAQNDRLAMFAGKRASAHEVIADATPTPTENATPAANIPTQATAAPPAEVPVVKRGRGRPRKHPLVPTAAAAAAAVAVPVAAAAAAAPAAARAAEVKPKAFNNPSPAIRRRG